LVARIGAMVCLCAVGGPDGANVFSWAGVCYQYIGPLGHNPLGTCLPEKPQRGDILVARIGAIRCLCAVDGPYRANVFSWAGACYQYIGPLGHNPFGPFGPHKPQRGDILVARIGAMLCLCAVGGPAGANVFFLGGGLLPIDWPAGPQSAGHMRAAPTP
jgi:hypothetical protein